MTCKYCALYGCAVGAQKVNPLFSSENLLSFVLFSFCFRSVILFYLHFPYLLRVRQDSGSSLVNNAREWLCTVTLNFIVLLWSITSLKYVRWYTCAHYMAAMVFVYFTGSLPRLKRCHVEREVESFFAIFMIDFLSTSTGTHSTCANISFFGFCLCLFLFCFCATV